MILEGRWVFLVASAAAFLVLAAVVAAVDFQKRVNRAFSAILALRGVTIALQAVAAPPRFGLAIAALTPYLVLPIVPLVIYFGSLYPRRRGLLGGLAGGWIALGAAFLLDAAYFLWHEGYYGLAFGDASPIMTARDGIRFTSFGPLLSIGMLFQPLMSGLSLLFAVDYVHSKPGAQRVSYFLMCAGFLLNGLFDGTRALLGLLEVLREPQGFAFLPWGWSLAVLPSISLLPAFAALALIARHHFASGRRAEAQRELRLFVAAGLAILTPVVSSLAVGGAFLAGNSPVMLLLLGIWRLSLPALVTLALLRYTLFDIDIKVRAAVAWGVVTVIFGFAWFIGSNLLQNVLAESTGTGTIGGLVAAGLLTFAAKPVVVFGQWCAAKLMPGVHDFSKKTREAAALYKEQFIMLQEDGVVTPKERASLERLRAKIGLPKPLAQHIEVEAMGKAGNPRGAGTAPA